MTQDTMDKLTGVSSFVRNVIVIVGLIATFSIGFNQIHINTIANTKNAEAIQVNDAFRLETGVRVLNIEKDVAETSKDVKTLLRRQ